MASGYARGGCAWSERLPMKPPPACRAPARPPPPSPPVQTHSDSHGAWSPSFRLTTECTNAIVFHLFERRTSAPWTLDAAFQEGLGLVGGPRRMLWGVLKGGARQRPAQFEAVVVAQTSHKSLVEGNVGSTQH